MKTKDFSQTSFNRAEQRVNPGQPLARSANRRHNERLGIGNALLGAICAAGVLALLGLLYTFG